MVVKIYWFHCAKQVSLKAENHENVVYQILAIGANLTKQNIITHTQKQFFLEK